MLDYDPLEGYRDAEAYDLENENYVADVPLTMQLARTHGSPILDLACGTGSMALRLAAQGFEVMGMDIVPEMIERARCKSAAQGAAVEWGVGDARTFQISRAFALICMLGNAFQHFLTRADHEALLARVRVHLTSEGRFFFATRNPTVKTLFEPRFSEPQTYLKKDGAQITSTEQPEYDPITQIQHWTFHNVTQYPSGETKEETFRTALRYVFPQEMEALLHYNGFEIKASYGSWQQEPLTAESRNMIYVCRKRHSFG